MKDNRTRFDSSKITMPKLLQQAGYQTAIAGKWHLHTYPTGFDYWKILPGQGLYFDPRLIGMKGDTATRTLKPATVETGATVNVPLFVNEGELIRVNTKSGEYVERVKE